MKLIKKVWQERFDFDGVYKCEHCGDIFIDGGYDDANYFNNVIPNSICDKCGLNSSGETKDILQKRVGMVYRLGYGRRKELNICKHCGSILI